MRALRTILAAVAAALALRALAVPFHGCTFFNPRLAAQSMACASFRVDFGACWQVKCSPVGCITYPGALFTGWMPEYFLEVTNRAGQSAFASADMPHLAGWMAKAAANWTSHGDVMHLSTTSERPRGGHETSMYFGRAIAVPYGQLAWYLKSVGERAGTTVPACYAAVTEFAAETWADRWEASGDRALATAWAAATAPVCGGAGALMGAVAAIPRPSMSIPASLPCAYPLSVAWQKAAAVATPNAADPLKQCMGALGGLVPRTGFTDGSTYTAAERIAWRTASLAEDYFRTGVGVQGDDKWQIVHPISTGTCFPPGSLLRPGPENGGELFGRFPPLEYDNALLPLHETDYVFAVWRRRQKCLEPGQHAVAQAEISTYSAVHTAACAAFNGGSGAP